MIIIQLGYSASYVMTKEDALALVGIIERSHKWEEKYVPAAESATGESHLLYYSYPPEEMPNMKIVNDSIYEMAKLAGKPSRSKS